MGDCPSGQPQLSSESGWGPCLGVSRDPHPWTPLLVIMFSRLSVPSLSPPRATQASLWPHPSLCRLSPQGTVSTGVLIGKVHLADPRPVLRLLAALNQGWEPGSFLTDLLWEVLWAWGQLFPVPPSSPPRPHVPWGGHLTPGL